MCAWSETDTQTPISLVYGLRLILGPHLSCILYYMAHTELSMHSFFALCSHGSTFGILPPTFGRSSLLLTFMHQNTTDGGM